MIGAASAKSFKTLISVLGIALMISAPTVAAPTSDIRADEEILFFPAMAYRAKGETNWQVHVRGCVFEPDKRGWAADGVSRALKLLGFKITTAEKAVLAERARLFTRDNERGKTVVIKLGDRATEFRKSAPDGRFEGTVRLSEEAINAASGATKLAAVLPAHDPRKFSGTVTFIQERGITVISDIDDTLKVTLVRDRKEMLRKSFLEPFMPVEGMAELYSDWAKNSQAQFYYVSASPWQFYVPLSEFMATNGFPAGMFALKWVRLKDRTLLSLFQDPEQYKLAVLEPFLRRFPDRNVVLVGDSGECDPEVYGTLFRRYPQQVLRIFIRDVTGEPADSSRYAAAFADVPPGAWKVFRDARLVERALHN